MARINYPETFAGQTTLLANIAKQNTKLGTKSPLIPYCKEHNLDFSKLQGLADPAAEQNNLHLAFEKSSENSTQQRDNNFTPVWKNLTLEVQFLKNFYKGSERRLGDWGITVDGTGKIVYPPDFATRAALVQTFLKKHNGYAPDESPLQMFIDEHKINVVNDLQATADAIDLNNQKNEQDDASKLATQQRNTIWQPALDAIHAFGAFLMGLYADDSRKMGLWGYKVVEEAAGEREQESTLKPLEKRLQKSIAVGTVFTNKGAGDLQVTKGSKEDGLATLVPPGGTLGMTKGYSAITVFNPSSLLIGKYTVVING